MSIIIGVVSQKGGSGKSTICRLVACSFAADGWDVKIADLDISQGTTFHWHRDRIEASIEPEIAVESFSAVRRSLDAAERHDVLIIDGAPHATRATQEIAENSNLVILPTGPSKDDMRPAVLLAHELVQAIPAERICFALFRTGTQAETDAAREYLSKAGYAVLDGELPDRTTYRNASDQGRAVNETQVKSLNAHANKLAQSIVNRIAELQNQKAA
jgi:chromosome partitioning protein